MRCSLLALLFCFYGCGAAPQPPPPQRHIILLELNAQQLFALQRGVEVALRHPLEPRLDRMRELALQWMSTTGQFKFIMCADVLAGLDDHPYHALLVRHFALATLLATLDHSDDPRSRPEVIHGSVEGLLQTYRALVVADTKATHHRLEALDQVEQIGHLEGYSRDHFCRRPTRNQVVAAIFPTKR